MPKSVSTDTGNATTTYTPAFTRDYPRCFMFTPVCSKPSLCCRAKVNMSHVGAEWFELRYINLCTYYLLIVAFRAFSTLFIPEQGLRVAVW